MPNAIETFNLARRFRRTEAVKGLTLQVPEGSIFALLGPNGAGKTTTLKLLMNLLRPSGGRATVLDIDSRRLTARHFERIGYVSENQKLPLWMTVDQLLDHCRPCYPTWDDGLRRTLQAALGLESRARLRTLSRGTRMKAALLASLVYRPDLLVLDEPFTGLDPVVRDELIRGLLEASGDGSRTVLISSHDIDDVERLADWVGFMNAGRIELAESVATLLARVRLVEVVAPDDRTLKLPDDPAWWHDGFAGRTLRFVDTAHDRPDAAIGITAAFPACDVRISPMSLREIFVTLAPRRAPSSGEAR
jgi:ABC-2 type transport system ATP-binding protein